MSDYRQIVKRFCEECVWSWTVRDQYRKIYEKGERRLTLLNEVASMFFHDLQVIMIEHIILQMCKLTESAKSNGHSNLSALYLVDVVPHPAGKSQELTQLVASLKVFRKKVVDARRKIIAHSDLSTFLSGETHGEFSVQDEELFWEDLRKIVDIFHSHYCNGMYPINAVTQYDAEDMVVALKKAVDYDTYFSNRTEEKIERRRLMEYEDA